MPRSIVSGDLDEILLADHHHELVEAARAVLATSDLPPVVLIGGLAVAMRVGSTGQPHRATVDIDLVTTETDWVRLPVHWRSRVVAWPVRARFVR